MIISRLAGLHRLILAATLACTAVGAQAAGRDVEGWRRPSGATNPRTGPAPRDRPSGRGGRQPGVAAAHFCAAARDGSVEGQYRLGRLYLLGRGVARDGQVANTLLSIAAQRGHEKAQSLVEPWLPPRSSPIAWFQARRRR
jgi:hypothetical protein